MPLNVFSEGEILEALRSISYEKDLIRLNPKLSLIIGVSSIKAFFSSLELRICKDELTVLGRFSISKSPSSAAVIDS